jgi:hypothetical protein
MPRQQIIETLAAQRADLTRLGVASLRLFGSASRNEAGPKSDIDVLVEFSAPATFDRYMDLRLFIEDLLGRRVDLVTEDTLRPEIREAVEREAIRVA